jgi:hypothetical protein
MQKVLDRVVWAEPLLHGFFSVDARYTVVVDGAPIAHLVDTRGWGCMNQTETMLAIFDDDVLFVCTRDGTLVAKISDPLHQAMFWDPTHLVIARPNTLTVVRIPDLANVKSWPCPFAAPTLVVYERRVAAFQDNRIEVYARDGSTLFTQTLSSPITAARFLHSNIFVAADKMIHVWNIVSGLRVLIGIPFSARVVEFALGPVIAALLENDTLVLADVRSGAHVKTIEKMNGVYGCVVYQFAY